MAEPVSQSPDAYGLTELRQLLDAATDLPWNEDEAGIDGANYSTVIAVEDRPAHAYPELQSGTLILAPQDAALIVAAVNKLPALLDCVDALEEAEQALCHVPIRGDDLFVDAAVQDGINYARAALAALGSSSDGTSNTTKGTK